MPNRRTFVATTGAVLLGIAHGLRAQVAPAPRRIGVLSPFARADVEALLALLHQELEKLGWTDGRNIAFLEPRMAVGTANLRAAAAELIAQGPDLVLVQSAPATRALMQATKTIPIVMVGVGNPVEYGMVASYAKPGGNVTGASYLADESIRKTLQLLKEAAPQLRSVAMFANPRNEAAAPMTRQLQGDVAAMAMQLQVVEVSVAGDFGGAFAAIERDRAESILLPPEPLIRSNRDAIGAFALAHRLPLAIVGSSRYLPPGGLFSYGPTTAQYAEITARYVDHIFRGATAGELPVEQPARFELAINLKTAAAIGLTIPQTMLLLADEVIR
jgi:putative ABC transport system substrate-binding protein